MFTYIMYAMKSGESLAGRYCLCLRCKNAKNDTDLKFMLHCFASALMKEIQNADSFDERKLYTIIKNEIWPN